MKKLVIILVFFTACRLPQEVQVTGTYAILLKKGIAYRGSGQRVVQYWRQCDDRGAIIFYEMLPEGDTGYVIGSIHHVLLQR